MSKLTPGRLSSFVPTFQTFVAFSIITVRTIVRPRERVWLQNNAFATFFDPARHVPRQVIAIMTKGFVSFFSKALLHPPHLLSSLKLP